jgi:predicted outer membrane repeat protein
MRRSAVRRSALRRKLIGNACSRGSIIATVLLLSTAAVCFARLILVPLEYDTIQAAINTSASGDTIRVGDGTYEPGNDLGAKDLVIFAETDFAATIGGDPAAEGFYLGGQTSATLIRGFRFMDCMMGVHVNGGDPRIVNCSMEGCSQSGVFCNQSGATFQNCNSHDNTGAGFRLSASHVYMNGCYAIQNHQSGIEIIGGTNNLVVCLVEGNFASSGGGGISCDNASPQIQMITIGGNKSTTGFGGGILVSGNSNATINSCTISRNAADQGGGIYVESTASAAINNTILWGNCVFEPNNGIELWAEGSASVTFDCCCVNPAWNVGSGVIYDGDQVTDDPHFCDLPSCESLPTGSGSYMLASDSPALGATCGPMGTWGEGCSFTPVQLATWGKVRQLFR